MQLKATLVSPPLVVRFSDASPPRTQMLINSFTEAPRNWEFVLKDIFRNLECLTRSNKDHHVSLNMSPIFMGKRYIIEVAR